MALRQLESLVHVHISKNQQHGVRRSVVRLEKLLDVIECRGVQIVKIAVKIMRIRPVTVSDGGKVEPGKSAVGLIEDVDADFFLNDVALITQILIVHLK